MKLRVIDVEPPSAAEMFDSFDTGDMADMWINSDDKRLDFFDDILFNEAELSDILDGWNFSTDRVKDIVTHDCMWSGACSDKYHPGHGGGKRVPLSPTAISIPPTAAQLQPTQKTLAAHSTPPATQAPAAQTAVQPGRSLLLSAARPQTVLPPPPRHTTIKQEPPSLSPRRPDTPQSLDEEEFPVACVKQEYAGVKQEYDDDRLGVGAMTTATATTTIAPRRGLRYSDDEDDEADRDDDEDRYEEDEDDDDEYRHQAYQHHQHQSLRSLREHTIATDHSYTLSKNSKQARVDLPGVQTPSDSEEEIDVVSVSGDKLIARGPAALPSNPSPLARRQLQRTMASAVAERSGLSARAPPTQPRKRARDRSLSPTLRHRKKPKTAGSGSSSSSSSTTKARYNHHHHHHHHNSHHSSSHHHHHHHIGSSGQQHQHQRHSPSKRRPYSSNSDSEAENIERRSLHNDMERQRRIGLKNLFEELKREVPAICHKDRAPKVVVLREAAVLCARLQRDERERALEHEQLRARQSALRAQVRQLRVELASRRPKNA